MADVGFYHLTRSKLDRALPQLLVRTLAAGERALVLCSETQMVEEVSATLWSQPAWLPHGVPADGDPDIQPIWISTDPKALNGARYLFLVENAATDRLADFDRVFDLFDGTNDLSLKAARVRWRAARDGGHTVTYWRQTDRGWQKQA